MKLLLTVFFLFTLYSSASLNFKSHRILNCIIQEDDSVKTFHVVSDAGGNVTNLVESHDDGSLTMANTYEYGPFGQVVAKIENVEMPYQFNTKMVDAETGLSYYGYRFYDSVDGRWLNRDPIGVNGGINVYNSVSNNMVNGFNGGLSHSGGMGLYVGDSIQSIGVDPYGEKVIFTKAGVAPPQGIYDYRPWVEYNIFYTIVPEPNDPTNQAGNAWNSFAWTFLSTDPKDGSTLNIPASKGCGVRIAIETRPIVGFGNNITSGSKTFMGLVNHDSYSDIRTPSIPVPAGGFPKQVAQVGTEINGKFEAYYNPQIIIGVKNKSLWWAERGSTSTTGPAAKYSVNTGTVYPVQFVGVGNDRAFVTKSETVSIRHTVKGPVRILKKGFGGGLPTTYLHRTGDIFFQDKTSYKIKITFK